VTTNETLAEHIDTMAEAASVLQPDAPPDVICYGCTCGSIVIGEEPVMEQIKKGAPKSKPMTLVTGVVDALRELSAQKLVVGTPYLDEINTLEAEFLLEKGFEVVDIQGLNVADGSQMGRVTPGYLKEFALSIDSPDADAIFISCGGIRSLDVAEEIEEAAGKPVITSNQAMMWSCLRRAGIDDRLTGFGRIFQEPGQCLPRSEAA
jgi:maleate isomerase